MSLVSKDALENIKRQRSKAKETVSYEKGYQCSIRGLDAAIALLEQIDHITKDITFETKITLRKE